MRIQQMPFGAAILVALCATACSNAGLASGPALTAPSGVTTAKVPTPGVTLTASPRLPDGLASNLDELTSYQFSWGLTTAPLPGTPAPDAWSRFSGTVINSPTPSARTTDGNGAEWIAVDQYVWYTLDAGRSWNSGFRSTSTFDLDALGPQHDYRATFDEEAWHFELVGAERRNGVDCSHYRADSAAGPRDGVVGDQSDFRAEVWVAMDGDYPVSGFFGFDIPGGPGYGYRFEITHVNDPANGVTPPSGDVPTPTPVPTAIPNPTGTSNVVAWGGKDVSGVQQVPNGLSDAVAVAVGYAHALALRRDGTVVAWGENVQGEGDVPPGLTHVVAIAAGDQWSLALRSDGTVVGWGEPTGATPPPGLSHVVAISAGSSYSLALKADGTVVGWGAWPAEVPAGLTHVVAISAGNDHSLALRSDGTMVAWGRLNFQPAYVPAGLSGVIAISASGAFDLALKSDGTVVAWGDALGYGQPPADLSDVTAISGGCGALALKRDGSIVAWGDATFQAVTPALTGVTAIASGCGNALAVVTP
jgi:hypothetical protein